MKPAQREPGRDEVIAVPDWLFEDDQAGAAESAEALLSHACPAVETWEPQPQGPVPLARDEADGHQTQEFEPVAGQRRAVRTWLWAAAVVAAAVGAGSTLLAPALPQLLECQAPMPLSDAVVAAVRAPSVVTAVSAPAWMADDSPRALPRAPRKSEPSAAVQKLLAQGTAAAKAGHHYTAWGLFERARALSPKNADAFYGIALAQYELGNRRLAQLAVARAITHEPDHPGATLLLGFIEQEKGAFANSRKLYEDYLTHAPATEYASELKSVLAHLPKR